MDNIIPSIQEKLNTVTALKYVDEDWGQLDEYGARPPVGFPCALIDLGSGEFDELGNDKKTTPQLRQTADIIVNIKIADQKLTNTSFKAPELQKHKAWSIWNTIEEVHKVLQGVKPTENTGALIRSRFRRAKRGDGILEITVSYTISATNV